MRLRVLKGIVAGLVLCVYTAGHGQEASTNASELTLVYVGTSGEAGKGIHLFRLQTDNLEVSQNITLAPLGLAVETPNPTFLEVDRARRLLFAVNETEQFEGKPTGSVSAFTIDGASGKLKLVDQRATLGVRPCQLVLDKDAAHAIVANCGSGTLTVVPVAADGRFGEPTAPTPIGKAGAGDASDAVARCLTFDPAGRFAFACDAASDTIAIFRFDAAKGTLTPGEPSSVALASGAGPRHLVFRPDGRFAYASNELSSTVTVFAYDANTGALTEMQSVSTVPEYFDGPNAASEVAMHPSGKYLYVANRGHNSVVLFTIDADSGALTFVEEQGTGGTDPRHFGLEPSARHLAIANQGSDTLLASRIDAVNGRLKPSGVFASAPSPVFVKFVPPASEK